MQQVKNGDTIQVHYHGTLASGETFDSSNGRETPRRTPWWRCYRSGGARRPLPATA